MRTARLALAAAIVAAAAPATASAATDHSGSVDVDHPSFAWDSKLGTGFIADATLKPKVPCGTAAVHDCDTTLIHVTGPGTLTVTNSSDDPNAIDTDLYLYLSDASGTIGDQVSSSAQSTPTPNETVAAETDDGDNWFVAEIDYSLNVGGTIHGVATFTPAPPDDGSGDS
jgi:hypothetical protein